jgi:polar amino acid transport system permease protein
MTTERNSLPVVPVRHWGRYAGGAVILVLLAMVIHTLWSRIPTGAISCTTTDGIRACHKVIDWRFSWHVVGQYFTTHEILSGLFRTIYITAGAMVLGISLGVLIAIMRVSPSRVLSGPAWVFTWFFRGTPVFVQILFWFNITAVFPDVTIGIPFSSVTFVHLDMLAIFTPITAGIVALGLNEAAYMSEIARAGLVSVEEGQVEAATSLGMTRGQTMRYVILPQAMRVIIPPTGNEVISMLKTSSLVSSIGVLELLGTAQAIYAGTYQIIPMLIVASLWFLVVTTVLSIGQFYLERYFAKGALRTPPPTPWQRLVADVKGIARHFPTRSRS